MGVQCSEHFLRDTVERVGAECTHILGWSPLWLWEHVLGHVPGKKHRKLEECSEICFLHIL